MMTVPGAMLLSRPPWYEALIKRLAQRWLQRHDPHTLALMQELPSKLSSQSQWLDKAFPPPDAPDDEP